MALSAAMLGDSAVVTWSQGAYGGDSGAVEDEQRNEQQIQAFGETFDSILPQGSLAT